MESRFEAVNTYFSGWVSGDTALILDALADDIYIEECYGPCYRGKEQVAVWLEAWFAKGVVNEWQITDEWFLETAGVYFCKWEFDCTYKGERDRFAGISKITFTAGLIGNLEEFQSTIEHKYPY